MASDQENCEQRLPPISEVICVDDFEKLANQCIEKTNYDYICGGADEELTLARNRNFISDHYNLRPRVMSGISQVDLTKYIFGDKLSMPIGISPTALHKMVHPSGELGMVRACSGLNALMIHSFFSSTSLEALAKEAPICTKWQNIYMLKQREITQRVVNRAIRYGYRALVVTCDAPVLGTRRRDLINQFSLGAHKLEVLDDPSIQSLRQHSSAIFDPTVGWSELAELKKSVGDTIRVVVKGIMTPEDAELAIKAGVDAIFVSNHGGRQLDRSPSTVEVLPAIVRQVNKRCPILIDGGFRTGTDILTALALGADMVFIGRSPLFALGCYGELGVDEALNILKNELSKAMMLCGCKQLSDIDKNVIIPKKPGSIDH